MPDVEPSPHVLRMMRKCRPCGTDNLADGRQEWDFNQHALCTDASTRKRCPSIHAQVSSHVVDWKPALLHERRSYTSSDKERVSFGRVEAPAIHSTVLKFRLHINAVNSAHLDRMDKIECGWAPPLPRVHHYDGVTGFHLSRS